MSSTTLSVVIHGVMGLAIVVAATVLLALNKVDATVAMALYAGAIGLVGGSANTALALRVPAPPQGVTSPPPPGQ